MAQRDDPAPDDARDALQLTATENADLCAGCTRCCETVSIEIDAPRTSEEYDQWLWVLHHRGLELYVERPERWYLHIETRCEQLNAAGRCAIHGSHPVLCREYDPRSCERRAPLSHVVGWFHDAAEFETWLARQRPAHHRRLLAWRREKAPAPPRADARRERSRVLAAALVSITEPQPLSR